MMSTLKHIGILKLQTVKENVKISSKAKFCHASFSTNYLLTGKGKQLKKSSRRRNFLGASTTCRVVPVASAESENVNEISEKMGVLEIQRTLKHGRKLGVQMKRFESKMEEAGPQKHGLKHKGKAQAYMGQFSLPLRDSPNPVVALGKFDALHIGHRALAERAASMGEPWLLSFAGMAEVLGWEPRLPLVAQPDRFRVMHDWGRNCAGVVPRETSLQFQEVRSLLPEEFVKLLANELRVKGVVAGGNYRFGYKAAGDATDLEKLGRKHGLLVSIVEPVVDSNTEHPGSDADVSGGYISGGLDWGQVSSTRVRQALKAGDVDRVAELLGRRYRLLISLDRPRDELQGGCCDLSIEKDVLSISSYTFLNQPPCEGVFWGRLICLGKQDIDGITIGNVRIEVLIDEIVVHLDSLLQREAFQNFEFLAIEF